MGMEYVDMSDVPLDHVESNLAVTERNSYLGDMPLKMDAWDAWCI